MAPKSAPKPMPPNIPVTIASPSALALSKPATTPRPVAAAVSVIMPVDAPTAHGRVNCRSVAYAPVALIAFSSSCAGWTGRSGMVHHGGTVDAVVDRPGVPSAAAADWRRLGAAHAVARVRQRLESGWRD